MLMELPILAVDGNEILGSNQIEHEPQLLGAGVPGDVDGRLAPVVVMDAGAAAIKVVNHAEDGLLVTGNDARGNDDFVVGLNREPAVVVHGHAGERRHGFVCIMNAKLGEDGLGVSFDVPSARRFKLVGYLCNAIKQSLFIPAAQG